MFTEKQCFHQHVSHRLMRLSSFLTSRPLSNLAPSHRHIRRAPLPQRWDFFPHKTSDSTTSQYVIPHHTTTTTTTTQHNTMAPHSLPVRGNSNAADTTTTNTTSAQAEVFNNNATIFGNAAADSSFDDLFDEDVDYLSGSAPASPSGRADDDLWEDDMSEEDVAAFQAGAFDFFAADNGNGAGLPGAHVLAPAAAADGNIAAPILGQNAPANGGAPAKRPRGRPPGKAPPKAKVTYRCRYGCERLFVGEVALRKHMMRVHCIFSAAHTNVQKCISCTRLIDPGNMELACNKRRGERMCPAITDEELAKINVVPPRDAQEEADTFAYANSGPNGEGPSRLVVVLPGDNEKERREACRKTIDNYYNAAFAHARLNNGLLTPEKTPSQQSVIDLTGDDEEVPASPTPAYEGKGKKRAVEFSDEPAPKRMREVAPTHQARYNGLQTGAGPAPRHDSTRNDHQSLETQAPATSMAHPVISDAMGAHISALYHDLGALDGSDIDLSAWDGGMDMGGFDGSA
jgi:hypothetical protein